MLEENILLYFPVNICFWGVTAVAWTIGCRCLKSMYRVQRLLKQNCSICDQPRFGSL